MLTSVLVLCTTVGTARAETISVTGTAGTAGTTGADGTPGLPGTDGSDGEDAVAIADAPGEDNSATATGGQGGRGGSGGDGIPNSGADGGDGANGGRGGDAIADATTVGAYEVRAIARGGDGGFPGSGGRGSFPGVNGQQGTYGGEGGDAVASARITNDTGASLPFLREGLAIAEGGHGSNHASGGDAHATLVGEFTGGIGTPDEYLALEAYATGGNGGFQDALGLTSGGDAVAEVTGSTTYGRLSILADADGGRGGSVASGFPSGPTGAATATASGTHFGSGTLDVRALANPGRGSGNLGMGSASASGIATNGADVRVEASVSGGAQIELRDAVSGSTSGLLELIQQARLHVSGLSPSGGNAVTSLNASNPGGGDLMVSVTAGGGIGIGSTSDAGNGGNGIIEFIDATGEQDVTVEGTAIGGRGGASFSTDISSGSGGVGTIGSIMGRSTGGGTVVVEGAVRGGSAGSPSLGGSEIGGGGRAIIDNVVDGETTGDLTLRQTAISGGRFSPTNGDPPPVQRDAYSRLDRVRSAEHFTIRSEAEGLSAEAFGQATNTTGSVEVEVVATGQSRPAFADGKGGDAYATASGSTQMDGQSVLVGSNTLVNAQGGQGGEWEGSLGAGGSATSQSTGIALGNSLVSVFDRAVGGEGAFASTGFVFPPIPAQPGADGGDASSWATASNAGDATVIADARATGGLGRNAIGVDMMGGRGGDATASAHGESTGGADVRVRAEAIGGRGGFAANGSLAGNGGDATVEGLTGSTSGRLTLEARAVGGRGGGESIFSSAQSIGRGGDAFVSIDATNEGGGDLQVIAEGSATRGGRVHLGTIRGSSDNGANVQVDGILDEGGQRFGPPLPEGVTYNDSISLVNAVQGDTSGELRLRQSADGGFEGGVVESRLTNDVDRAGTILSAEARARDGADAVADAETTNTIGAAFAEASAYSDSGQQAIAEADALGAGSDATRALASSQLGAASGALEARSSAHGVSTGDGDVEVAAISTASGGGVAIATAYGQNAGAGDVEVGAFVYDTGDAGLLQASADGRSTGGGNVSVTAEFSRTEDSGDRTATVVRDAVSGGTAGLLSLRQAVRSLDGDVATSLEAENEGGGALSVDVSASSWRAFGDGPGPASEVVFGDVIGRSSTGADVDVSVSGTGGSIRFESDSDPSQPSRILGVSTSGAVAVGVDLTLTDSTAISSTGSEIRGESGRSISLENLVAGVTTGALTLSQDARAGSGALTSAPFGRPDVAAFSGDGGRAENVLHESGAFDALTLGATAYGGYGGHLRNSTTGTAGDGGGGRIDLRGGNSTGSVELQGTVRGGDGGGGGGFAGSGGDADARFWAQSVDDDRSVLIGRDASTPPIPRLPGAQGGNGGDLAGSSLFGPPPNPDALAGSGGNATSHSEGRALGDSRVEVYDVARGGHGGWGAPNRFFPPQGGGGRGGFASSDAFARGGGSSLVSARAEAHGGHGGLYLLRDGEGGDARAAAQAIGAGEVQARAIARGGASSLDGGIAGSAVARTEASGTTGVAVAEALSGSGSAGGFRSTVSRSVTGKTLVKSAAIYGASIPQPSRDLHGSAFVAGALPSSVLLEAVEIEGSLETALAERAGAVVKAIGGWQSRTTEASGSVQTTELDITLATPDSGADLILAIFDLDATNGGFEELAFRLEVFGELFGEEQVFTDFESAREFFASEIVLGAAYIDQYVQGSTPAVRAIFDVASSAGQRVGLSLAAVVVPEPSTAILLGLGLVFMARRRRDRDPAP